MAERERLPYPAEFYPGCPCYTCDSPTWPVHAVLGRITARMSLCPACGNKRCPGAADHARTCSGSNEPGQAGSLYPADGGVLVVHPCAVIHSTSGLGVVMKHQVQPGSGHPPSEPQARWTLCGRLMMRPLLWLPDGLTECGQCVRRRAAL